MGHAVASAIDVVVDPVGLEAALGVRGVVRLVDTTGPSLAFRHGDLRVRR
jgi:hypothetical protein